MSLKRALSDSECDGDDLYSDTKDSCMTPPESCGGGTVSRKKRRGIIEKRRRDRINNSLTELRRLVPTAFEKHGSAKLEKAEILQMTVDHLKMLHAKGFDALAYDPHKFALDYHSIGFRECAAEVARYLVAVEGWDIQDPLRLRLMSHLQCFASQRELANKQASATSWGLTPPNHTYTLPNSGGIPSAPSIQPAQALMESPPNHMNHQNYHHNTNPNMTNNDLGGHLGQPVEQQYMTSMSPGAGHRTSYSQNQNQHLNSHSHHHQAAVQQQNQIQNNQMSYMTNNNTNLAYPMPNAWEKPSGGKPYRPWGAELAY